MSEAPILEQLIEVASRLKESVAGLYLAYSRLPEVISREERAIAERDFVEVSAKCVEKEELGCRIESLFSAMALSGEKIHQISCTMLEVKPPRPVNLSEYTALLQELATQFGAEAFAGQVLNHVVTGLAATVAEFFTLYTTVKPQIEANRYLVTKMLTHFQQSYRFWQEVTEQLAVSYNAHGIQQAQGRNHGFKARA